MAQDTQSPDSDSPRKLQCPKCSGAMEAIVFHDIQVDRCTACQGLWFDALEKEHLDTMRGSESIDIGAAAPAAGPIKTLICPVCHTQMIKMVDHRHPDVHYESCSVCFGLFFDSGEFRHHKESSILGRFRDLFHG